VPLTIPLYSGGMRTAKYAKAVKLGTQAQDETALMRLRAGQEARAAWLGLRWVKVKSRRWSRPNIQRKSN